MTELTAEGNLSDIRVIELADEQAEYAGRLLAGLGAEVIKIEPPGGNSTRRIGPFYEDEPGPERSLFFWHYNLGKRSVELDLEQAGDRERLLELLAKADLFLESTEGGYLERLGLDAPALLERFPNLVVARMSPFGDSGPWKDYKGSDLVHLALGGPMMNCGYDPQPDGTYDLPPIAPQMWHAYHIAGEQMAINIMGALLYRRRTGEGQYLSCAIHDAVAKNTELDLMTWIYRRAPYYRQTCSHASEAVSAVATIGPTKDGRWFWTSGAMGNKVGFEQLVEFLDGYGLAADLKDPRYVAEGAQPTGVGIRGDPEVGFHQTEVMHRLLMKYRYEDVPWRDAQEAGFMWVPVRKPHENALDEHWLARGSFATVEHEDIGRSFLYTTSKWVSTEAPWKVGPRAPHVGEHTTEVLAELGAEAPRTSTIPIRPNSDTRRSRLGKPFALDGVRILDFTWWLASGGAPRFLSALGADDIKVEWNGALDLRLNMGQSPIGGKEAREKATEPLPPDLSTINLSGQFNDFHAGQRGISLNVRHPKGLEIVKRLVAECDIVAEGFSPGVMESWGLGYDVLREIKPDIIYVQQSGMGAHGRYGPYRTAGPIAGAMAALSEMSGLPEPAPPAGWGYSYLDWFGAYNLATAMMAGLNYRARTGKGQWIDSSQVDSGIYINGTSVLEWSANGRVWQRYGNRSPYKLAAPHGAYRCRGVDRWLAIACFSEDEWSALVQAMGSPSWAADPRFATLASRVQHQDELDALVTGWTSERDEYEMMHLLQRAGVPAGVCQDAQNRVERDAQLASLEWLTEVTGTEIGTWPVKEVPVKMSATPPFMGGPIDRAAPCYGEDNVEVYGELLGMSPDEVAQLAEEGVI